jgi:hypothetical protein
VSIWSRTKREIDRLAPSSEQAELDWQCLLEAIGPELPPVGHAHQPSGDAHSPVGTLKLPSRTARPSDRKQGLITSWGGGAFGFMRSLALHGPLTEPQIAQLS